MTEAIEFHNVIEMCNSGLWIYVYLTKRCIMFYEIDTLPVHVQGVLFLKEFRSLTISPISKSTLLA